MNKPVSNFLIILLSIVFSIVLVEVVLRFTSFQYLLSPYHFFPKGFFITDEKLGHDLSISYPKSHFEFREVNSEIWTNELGCYDLPYNSEKEIILLVGDSFTWGYVPFESTYGFLLENILKKRVLKCGVVAYGTKQSNLKVQKIINKISTKPALVILGYFENDIRDDYFFHQKSGIKQDFSNDEKSFKAELKAWFAANSIIYNLFKKNELLRNIAIKLGFLKHQAIDLTAEKELFFLYLSPQKYPWMSSAWEIHLESLKEMKSILQSYGIELLIVHIPLREIVYDFLKPFNNDDYDWETPHKTLSSFFQKEKIHSLEDLHAIVFYEKPILKLERLLETYYYFAPRGFSQFRYAIRSLLFDKKLFLKELLGEELKKIFQCDLKQVLEKLYFSEHHLSHAASAFYPSPFEEAAILTIDGVGEWATSTMSLGRGDKIEILRELRFPNSVGLLYSAFTYYCGFKVNSGEYKLMGLAPYGDKHSSQFKKFLSLIQEELVSIAEDGSILLNQKYFDYCTGLKMVKENEWKKLFGLPPRKPESSLSLDYANLALAIQTVTEEIVFKMAKELKKLTQSENLCMAGGVALNCVANGKLLINQIFKNLWIQPASGDAGGALGSALAFYHLHSSNHSSKIQNSHRDKMKGSYLGPSYERTEILKTIYQYNAAFEEFTNETELLNQVAQFLAEGKIIGWFQGRTEWGPRALGNRSIIADPTNSEMQKEINLRTKFREGFRPFAPAVLIEDVKTYFENGFDSPYMLLIDYIKKERRKAYPENYHSWNWQEKLYFQRSDLPAITHIDYSARVQTVYPDTNPKFYKLIQKFKERKGYGVIINTSFNVRSEPIVNTPDDAYKCFMRTNIDYLVIENFLFDKKNQPTWNEKEDWKDIYEID